MYTCYLCVTKREKIYIVIFWSLTVFSALSADAIGVKGFGRVFFIAAYAIVILWGISNLTNRWSEVSFKQRFLNGMTKSPISPKLDKVHQILMVLGFIVIVLSLIISAFVRV